ncbi:MAG: hypothetical protein QOF44_809, partial [Streptomyces sp.]|nr:hypothetical protein [Streptomyces sp.]
MLDEFTIGAIFRRRIHRLLLAAVCAVLVVGVALGTASRQPAFALGSHTASSRSAAASGSWTGSWSVSPQGGGASFSQQTLRQIVHTSIGGTSARVEVSNAFGSQPLVI